MDKKVLLRQTSCAICGRNDHAKEIYPSNFEPAALNRYVFSARRLPDGIRYRIVKCRDCGLVRSDPVAEEGLTAQLYTESSFDYDAELKNIIATYGRYLRHLEKFGVKKGSLLEIGCGNGFLLEEALAQGYACVHGVEPSQDAVSRANDRVRAKIVNGLMRPGIFQENYFDVICMFQVLDHISDPGGLLKECYRILKPKGLVLCLNHNVEAFSARLLKSRSPIIDIEHTYLFSPRTQRRIFQKYNFTVRQISAAYNRYSLLYFFRLLPLPAPAKNKLLGLLQRSGLAGVNLVLPLGNMFIVAEKPSKG